MNVMKTTRKRPHKTPKRPGKAYRTLRRKISACSAVEQLSELAKQVPRALHNIEEVLLRRMLKLSTKPDDFRAVMSCSWWNERYMRIAKRKLEKLVGRPLNPILV